MDLKIRLSGEHAESWITHCMPKILSHDWNNQRVGVYHFEPIAYFVENKKVAQLSMYRTKSLRVAFISATMKFPE